MRDGPGGPMMLAFALGLLLVPGGGASLAQEKKPAGAAEEPASAVRAEGTVECLLPAEIDRLGSQLTKLGPRRTIETTAEDCAERQGEVVDRPR